MPTSSTSLFYSQLPTFQGTLGELLTQSQKFQPFPTDWHVVLTDIAGSTQAVQRGLYRDVNLLAASSVIASLNITKKHSLNIPFVFGGDGATLVVPEKILTPTLAALKALRFRAKKNFGLELRVGSLSMAKIMAANQNLKLSKLHVSQGYNQAVFLGTGLVFAERWIKDHYQAEESPENDSALDLDGLECRWNEVPAPTEQHQILSLIIQPQQDNQHQVFGSILQQIDQTVGEYAERHPLRTQHLKLSLQFQQLKKEAQIKFTAFSAMHSVPIFIKTFFANRVFRSNGNFGEIRGNTYLNQLILATDTLKIDGTMKTTLAGTREQCEKLLQSLDAKEASGEIWYGHHLTNKSVITCFVQNRNGGHIHFLDGAGGGYTQAAKALKRKFV